MPRQSYKILNFDGGRNSKHEARDIKENELADAVNVDISNPGYIQLAGNFLQDSSIGDGTVGAFTNQNNSLYAFAHDYEIAFTLNFTDGDETISVGDTIVGATSGASGVVIKETHSGSWSNDTGTLYLINVKGPFTNTEELNISGGATSAANANGTGTAPAESTSPIVVFVDADKVDLQDEHTNLWYTDVLDIGATTTTPVMNYYYYDGALRVSDGVHSNGNTPKWFGHIKKDMMSNLLTSSGSASSNKPSLNTWVKDEVVPTPPSGTQDLRVFDSYSEAYPTDNEKVLLKFRQRTADDLDITGIAIDATTNIATVTCADHSALGFGPGTGVVISGSTNHNGEFEIIGTPSTTTFTFEPLNTTAEGDVNAIVRKDTDSLNSDLKDKWSFGMSYIYDKDQESLITTGFKWDGSGTSTSDYNEMGTSAGANYVVDWTSFINEPECFIGFQYDTNSRMWNQRIKGLKIYMKRVGNNGAEGDWLLFSVVDFERGEYRIVAGADTWRPLHENSSNAYQINNTTGLDEITNLPIDTFESENFFPPDVDTTTASWKTATVVNRTTYAGNVIVNGRTYPDRVIKSALFSPDVFPNNIAYQVDVLESDGDSIVHLEGVGDRLFVFKKTSLTVINTAGQTGEFIESSMPHLGVSDSAKVCKAEGGIAWMNQSGLFYFDGNSTTNLIDDKFDSTVWSAYAGLTSTMGCIGYSPTDRKLIVRMLRFAGYGFGFVYDFKVKSFFYSYASESPAAASADYTNFAFVPLIDELILGEVIDDQSGDRTVEFKKWTEAPENSYGGAVGISAGGGMQIRTKDIDFGEPGVRKKIYKIYITYKTGAGDTSESSVAVAYNTNGEDSTNTTVSQWISSSKSFKAVSNCTVDSGVCYLDESKSEWTTAIMRPATSSEANNIYSFQLMLYNKANEHIHSDFKINDITIIYRIKPVR